MATHTREDVLSWRGRDLIDNDGDKIGSIDDIYLDRETDQPEWAVVTTGLFGTKRTFVPLSEAQPPRTASVCRSRRRPSRTRRGSIPTGSSRATRSARSTSTTGASTPTTTRAPACSTPARAATSTDTRRGERGGPGTDTSGPNTDEAMTRSEEELRVGTTEREAGRVRLKKYVVEDQVTETVPVRREEVRVEREPITDANRDAALDGPGISEEEHEVTLRAEEPVVEKRDGAEGARAAREGRRDRGARGLRDGALRAHRRRRQPPLATRRGAGATPAPRLRVGVDLARAVGVRGGGFASLARRGLGALCLGLRPRGRVAACSSAACCSSPARARSSSPLLSSAAASSSAGLGAASARLDPPLRGVRPARAQHQHRRPARPAGGRRRR